MRRPGRVAGAAAFVVPLLALLVVWEAVVRAFDVSPRVFPAIEPVVKAGIEATLDGTLIRHIGASLGRIALGTLIGVALAVPLGIAMGTNRALWAAQDRLNRLGILKSTFDVNKHIEPKYILNVMKNKPELFSDLPPIPNDVALKPGFVFKP